MGKIDKLTLKELYEFSKLSTGDHRSDGEDIRIKVENGSSLPVDPNSR